MKWQTSKYGWLLGHVQPLSPGEAYLARKNYDFLCLPESFRGYVYQAASEKGWKASAMVFSHSVVYVFYRPNDLMRPNLPAYPIVKSLRREN